METAIGGIPGGYDTVGADAGYGSGDRSDGDCGVYRR